MSHADRATVSSRGRDPRVTGAARRAACPREDPVRGLTRFGQFVLFVLSLVIVGALALAYAHSLAR
jgi:hypothetical protein